MDTLLILDLVKVGLMNFRVEYVRPRSGRCLGREATERATKSREVDLSRLKSHLRFAPKMRRDMTFEKYRFHSNQNNRMCVRFSCIERATLICLLCTKVITNKDFKRKLTIYRVAKKDQSLFES